MADEKPPEGTPAPDAAPAFDKAAYDAGLQALLRGEAGDEPAAEEKPPKPEGEADADAEAKPDAELAEDDEAESEGDEDKEPKVAEEALRKLQKEKRTFETYKAKVLEQERAVVAREQRVGQGERELVGFLNDFKVDPVHALVSNGLLTDEQLSYAARQMMLLSPEGLKDPRSRAEAERLRADMKRDLETRRVNAELENLRKEREAEKAQAQADRELNNYVTQIDASLPTYKAKTPLLAKAMEKDASATKRELYSVATELATANGGRFVEPGKVLLAWEKQQRELIARLGFSQPETPPAGQSKAKPPTAAKKQGHEQNGKGAPPASEPAEDPDIAKSPEEFQAELRRRLKRS
jgi:hypothetical protein